MPKKPKLVKIERVGDGKELLLTRYIGKPPSVNVARTEEFESLREDVEHFRLHGFEDGDEKDSA